MIHATRRVTNKSKHKVKLDVTCDMSGLSEDQIKEYAFDSIWIDEQARLRELSDKDLDAMEGEYSFTAVEKSRTKGPKDPVKAFLKALPTMTKEQKAEALKALEGK